MKSFNLLLNNMSKLNNAPIVHGEPTNFFAKKPSIFAKSNEQSTQNMIVTPSQVDTSTTTKRGRAKLENHDRKNVKLSLIFSEAQRELGIVLFNRIKQRLHPTEEALTVYREALKLLDGIDDIYENTASMLKNKIAQSINLM
jgi:hypothetical protein